MPEPEMPGLVSHQFSKISPRAALLNWKGILIFLALMHRSLSQIIVTSTNTEGAYTTGNMLDLADKLDLYSPPTYDIPMLLDAALYKNMSTFQDYKNNWIIDMSNIDPKEFAPEDPNYTLAVQRRGIPFFYLAKIIIIASLLLVVSRLFYGYLGGFRQKVKILKSPQKRIGNRIILIGTGLYFFFSTQYIVATYYSIDTTQKYLTSIIYNFLMSQNELETINNSSIPAYYAQNEFELFHISNLLNQLIPESEKSILKSKVFKDDIEKFQQRHLSRSILVVVGVYTIVALVNWAFRNRKPYYSLAAAFALLALTAFCCVLNGFYFNFATIKIELCQQTTEIVKVGKFPLYGQGVASIVTSFSNSAKTRMQEQIYEFNIGINSAFVMYINRLKALKKYDSWSKIFNDAKNQIGGVWNVFFDYPDNPLKDDQILFKTQSLIKQIWRIYYIVESLLESKLLKMWSYIYSNQVCRYGVAIDLLNFTYLFLCVLCIVVIFLGTWMNEYIVRCINYEESRFMNVEKYRYDWS